MSEETKPNTHMQYIEMCDSDGMNEGAIRENLQNFPASEQQIDEAYNAFYIKQNLYKIRFDERPLGLTILVDHIRDRLIIASMENKDKQHEKLKIGSRLYEIQGKRVDCMDNKQGITLIENTNIPFYVIFQEAKIPETKLSVIRELITYGYIRELSQLVINTEYVPIPINIFDVAMQFYVVEKEIYSSKSNEQRIFRVDNTFEIAVKDIEYNNEKTAATINNITDSWKDKDINDWNTDELTSWISSLGLESQYETSLVTQIQEQEIGGEDINSMESGGDIIDSFEDINDQVANKIFQEIENMRLRFNASNENKTEYDMDYDENPIYMRDSSQGIIGLNNLGNTCFINCVIQCLLQTPSLIQVFRKWSSNGSHSMLDSFISIAQAATQRNAKYNSVMPSGIVRSLRNSDVRFERGAQGDALSAVSKMIELLDKDIINRQKLVVKPMENVLNHPGSWHEDGILDEDEEDDLITGNCNVYNPFGSVIRDKIHFIERNILYCMNPGCDYKESRYEFREKVLLPLHDHCINIQIDIYIPSINQTIKAETFNILDYCAVNTLMHAIYKRVSNKIKCLKFINQIKIKMMKINTNNELNDWIKDIYPQNECKCLINNNVYIFALIQSLDESKKFMSSTFNVFLDENENICNSNQSYLQFNAMENGEIKTFEKINENGYNNNVYYKQEIISNYECKMDENEKIIICLWTHENLETFSIQNMDFKRKVYDGFSGQYSINYNINESMNGKVQNDIGNAFNVYLSDKLLDRGAVLKCNQCKRKSDVFMVETKIVQYPDILIFTIDRYIDGDKFREIVDYPHQLGYDNGYELYGVANHSGNLRGGHYWAYVKGIDDNNWYNANDSSISKMNPSSVINKASAIILMYKKIK